MAIKKNCNENGIRAEDLGSNPHSKGDLFSRSTMFFFAIKLTSRIIITLKVIEIKADEITVKITYTIVIDLLIGS